MRRAEITGWAVAALLFAAGPARARNLTIVVLGASTPAGKNLQDDPASPGTADPAPAGSPEAVFIATTSWVGRYQAYLRSVNPGSTVTIVNLAVPGYTTYEALPTGTPIPAGRPAADPAHNLTKALTYNPDAILLCFKGQKTFGPDEAMTNLHTMASAAAAAGVPVWVTAPQPDMTATNAANLIIQRDRTLAEFAPRAIDLWTPFADPVNPPLAQRAYVLTADDIHPSAAGHDVLFRAVKAANIQAALPPPPAPAPLTIVVMGASESVGKNLEYDPLCPAPCGPGNPNQPWIDATRWSGLLQAYLDVARPGSTVINIGKSGTWTHKWLPTGTPMPPARGGVDAVDPAINLTMALGLRPDVVVLNPGHLSDGGHGAVEAQANLLYMASSAAAAGVPVYVATPSPYIAEASTYVAALQTQRDWVLATFGSRAVDIWTPLADPSGSGYGARQFILSEDKHPNVAGHKVLFQQFLSSDFLGAPAPPSTPGIPVATALSGTQMALSWADASGEASYRVERSLDNVTFTTAAAGLAAGSTTFTDGGLSPSTRYYYRVAAVNATGQALSGVGSDVTSAPPPADLPPARPRNLRVR